MKNKQVKKMICSELLKHQGLDAESFSMKLGGTYKVSVSVEYIEE